MRKSENEAHGLSDENFVNYNLVEFIKEYHNRPLYGVEFCMYLKPTEPIIFATVGSSNVTFYECKKENILLLQCYTDPSPTEIFYTCCWSYDSNTLDVVLAAAGFHGIIRIIYPTKQSSKFLKGHLGAINDLKFHPKMPNILLSAGKDHSLRLWNIQSNICIGIFGGVKGHTDQVVSIDFDSMGNRIISGGADHFILIWRLDKSPVKEAIEAGSTFDAMKPANEHSFRTFTEHYPDFSTQDVYSDIVDCVKWLGNLILSKSMTNSIICWKPGPISETSLEASLKANCVTTIHQFDVDNCNAYWYVKFSMDISKKYMALGNHIGNIFLWSLENDDPSKCVVLKHPKCNTAVRQISFSRDSKILISVCEDSTVWRWNMS